MLGDSSSSVLATAATTSGGGGGGGGGGGTEAAASQLAVGARDGSSTEFEHHVGSNSGEDQERGRGEESRGADGGGGGGGDRSFGGNRWPRQETLALLKIRSDMDVAFRDASVKGPLWEDVSRKLAELGYHRSAKKCKEKFENVYKYHKRTKDGRAGKHDGKTYRFFDELEAFENHHHHSSTSSSLPSPPPSQPPKHQTTPAPAAATISMPVPNPPPTPHVTVPSTTSTPPSTNVSQGNAATAPAALNLTVPSFPQTNPTISPFSSQYPNPTNNNNNNNNPFQTSYALPSFTAFSSDLFSNSNSSSTSSDVELQGRGKSKRKRKWKDFFGRLMKKVIQKQEDMQKKFLEAIEKREHDRLVREESWRMQEMARINGEREILAQERSIAAAKDAAVMAFLQKVSEQQNPRQVQSNPQPQAPASAVPSPQPLQTPTPQPQNLQVAQAPAPPSQLPPQPMLNIETTRRDNGNQNNFMPTSSSRWPKVEVEDLIRLRTTLDCKYQDSGPKGPLWEEVSGGMRKLGYNRSAKRCKEKWENINKYFKKVKESNKKRPEDSKTCPYFHQLEALYKEKNKIDGPSSSNVPMLPKPENSVPLMVRPEQQWPPPPPPPPPQLEHRAEADTVMEDLESEDHPNHKDEDDKDTNEDDDDDDDDDDDEEEDEEAGGYEIVANKPAASMGTDE